MNAAQQCGRLDLDLLELPSVMGVLNLGDDLPDLHEWVVAAREEFHQDYDDNNYDNDDMHAHEEQDELQDGGPSMQEKDGTINHMNAPSTLSTNAHN